MLRQPIIFAGLLVAVTLMAGSRDALAWGGRHRTQYVAPTQTTGTSSGVHWQRNNWGVSGFGRNYGGASNGYGGYYYGPNSNYPIPGGYPAENTSYRR